MNNHVINLKDFPNLRRNHYFNCGRLENYLLELGLNDTYLIIHTDENYELMRTRPGQYLFVDEMMEIMRLANE